MTGSVEAAAPPAGHGLTGVADAGAFLARLARLDPAAVVRLRSAPVRDPAAAAAGQTVLWARLPWAVLVSRVVAGVGPGDATVAAAALLTELGRGGARLPARRDTDWRWPLPGSTGRVVETMRGADLRRIAEAAAGTVRSAAVHGVGGRAVGQRALRDALLDHVAVVVTGVPPDAGGGSAAPDDRIEVSQRLIQAIARMGFLGAEGTAITDVAQIRLAGRWVGLSAPFGSAWLPKVSQLALTPI